MDTLLTALAWLAYGYLAYITIAGTFMLVIFVGLMIACWKSERRRRF